MKAFRFLCIWVCEKVFFWKRALFMSTFFHIFLLYLRFTVPENVYWYIRQFVEFHFCIVGFCENRRNWIFRRKSFSLQSSQECRVHCKKIHLSFLNNLNYIGKSNYILYKKYIINLSNDRLIIFLINIIMLSSHV